MLHFSSAWTGSGAADDNSLLPLLVRCCYQCLHSSLESFCGKPRISQCYTNLMAAKTTKAAFFVMGREVAFIRMTGHHAGMQ